MIWNFGGKPQLRLLPGRHAPAPGSKMRRRGTWQDKRSISEGQLFSELGARSPLSVQFLSMDRYRSIAQFADFQVSSSLNRSKKNCGLLSEESAKMQNRS